MALGNGKCIGPSVAFADGHASFRMTRDKAVTTVQKDFHRGDRRHPKDDFPNEPKRDRVQFPPYDLLNFAATTWKDD